MAMSARIGSFVPLLDGGCRVLESLGLTPTDEAVYRALLRAPGSMAELAENAGIGRARLRTSLSRLADAGLLRQTGARVPSVVDPSVALASLIRNRRAELERASSGVEEFVEAFRTSAARQDAAHTVDVVTGREDVVRRTSDLAETVEAEILVFDTPPHASELGGEVDRELSRLRRGVQVKSLYSADALAVPGRLERVRALVRAGEQARVRPTLPLKLHIYDRRIAVVPLTSTSLASESVAIVHDSGLLDALVALFEALWQDAPRLDERTTGAHGLSEMDATVLELLSSGLKDDAVARYLGITVRTARRHISDLLGRLGATSRFQAGVEAHRRRWLE